MVFSVLKETSQRQREEVRISIAENLHLPYEKVLETTRFDSFGIDSLAVVDLTISLDSSYLTDIPASKDFPTIAELINYVVENSPGYKSTRSF